MELFKKMKLIAAVDKHWAIGNGNKLLTRIPGDMKFFRKMTLHKVVVVGRKTMDTFPNGLPLDQRTNIILSTNQDYKVKGAVVVHSMEELDEELKKYATDDIFVIGGESIYKQLADRCDTAYITKIDYGFHADTWMESLDESPHWELAEISDEQTYANLVYHFLTYRNSNM